MHLCAHDADKLFLHAEVSTLTDTNAVTLKPAYSDKENKKHMTTSRI